MARTYHHGIRQKKKKFGNYWWWYRSAPKEWRRDHKHRPQRQVARLCRHKVMSGREDVLWPLDRKPYEYYW